MQFVNECAGNFLCTVCHYVFIIRHHHRFLRHRGRGLVPSYASFANWESWNRVYRLIIRIVSTFPRIYVVDSSTSCWLVKLTFNMFFLCITKSFLSKSIDIYFCRIFKRCYWRLCDRLLWYGSFYVCWSNFDFISTLSSPLPKRKLSHS